MSDPINMLRQLANPRGLEIVDRGHGHIQLKGGPLLVNYYPFAKKPSAYVAGTTSRKVGVTPAQAVEMAFVAPSGITRLDERRGKYRKWRKALLKKDSRCHWCKVPLTLDSSTLDHVIPLAIGGLDNLNNCVLACEPCNNKRGHAMPELKEDAR